MLVSGPSLRPSLGDGGTDRATTVHIDDFGLRLTAGHFNPGSDGVRLVDALEAVSAGHADTDSLNRLVLAAGLTWPEVAVLRAYRRYRRQAGSTADDTALDDPLVDFPDIAYALVDYFRTRFDPDHPRRRDDRVAAGRRVVIGHLEAVTHLGADRVLRGYLALIDATLRTTYFLPGAVSGHRPTVAFKLECAAVPYLPAPHPLVETWVHGPQVEGIHLRFGRIARGGIRWSERPDDFRTEVLGLAEAQVKKNAVIVPTGAKGGFVCRGPGDPNAATVRHAYATFIAALLDITDNLVDGTVVTPVGVVARDGDDPYLVVAADKGTASFSDLANELAHDRGFWLDDAFASGGSHGYDHKAMGITARGAWVAVRRHFQQLGIDVATEPVSVAGVGDMSGDVFGNGMLQSSSIRLLAAFDHRHIFVDPDPDPRRAFDERARLAALPRSSWDDYDRAVISLGGGVWARDVKEITLMPAARRALGVGGERISPPELISAILAAPVDLLWFGGIGTYLKAPRRAPSQNGARFQAIHGAGSRPRRRSSRAAQARSRRHAHLGHRILARPRSHEAQEGPSVTSSVHALASMIGVNLQAAHDSQHDRLWERARSRRSRIARGGAYVLVELRATNHKYSECRVVAPRELSFLVGTLRSPHSREHGARSRGCADHRRG